MTENCGALILSLDDRCLLWNPDTEDWIVKRPVPGHPTKKWETVIEENSIELRAECPWCGTKQYLSEDLSPEMEEHLLKTFKTEHFYCGRLKKRINNFKDINHRVQDDTEMTKGETN